MSLVEQFVTSFGNFKGYRKLATLGFGKSFVFLLVFLIVVSVICGLKFAATINQVIDAIVVNIPDFVLARGTLTLIPNIPVRYELGSQVLIIDTTGDTTAEEFVASYRDGLFIGPYQLILMSQGRAQMLPWSELNPTQAPVTRDDFIEMLDVVKPWRFLAIPVYFVVKLIVKLLHILILSIAALVLNSIIGSQYDYPKLWNISLYAMVPITLLETVKTVADLPVPFWKGLYWLGALGIVAVVLIKLKKTPTEDAAQAGEAGLVEPTAGGSAGGSGSAGAGSSQPPVVL
ncbi:MAG TPA: DUF1189 domain-containing protein [Firmicutes bacterium]|nr:DUF1189 domain-containing protein [Candidatus Fermentithermobacillaceae bacterium]